MKKKFKKSPLVRFMEKIILSSNGCWIWNGANNSKGYGKLTVNKIAYAAHRWIYEKTKGPIIDECVLHKCDNPACVNPKHLRQGSIQENINDCISKKRNFNMRKTECPKGHSLSGNNVRIDNSGYRYCRLCNAIKNYSKSHKITIAHKMYDKKQIKV